ncbi:MAG: DUF2851 family protein [Bacteroidota bacterium]
MDEALLHYIWKFQRYNTSNLTTTQNEPITIFHPGFHNFDSGPDFSDARLRVGNVQWAGHVEIHTTASDWQKHRHHLDQAYENVVLHVVYRADEIITRKDGSAIPTLSLEDRLPAELIDKHRSLIHTISPIPCDSQISSVQPLVVASMVERALTERLQEKSQLVLEILEKTRGDWEQATYAFVATALGMKTNANSFRDLALSLPVDVIRKQRSNRMQAEALVFGIAGFLDYEPVDDYQKKLQDEFQFLFKKHQLPSKLNRHQWKFSKLRPANFPTVRLAQLSAVLHAHPALFQVLIGAQSYSEVKSILAAEPSIYWTQHYDFGKRTSRTIGAAGESAISSIVINAIVPLLFTYGKQVGNQELVEKALDWLTSIPAEDNKITRRWQAIHVRNSSAFDSQGLLQLSRQYCDRKKCLDCAIGNSLLSK